MANQHLNYSGSKIKLSVCLATFNEEQNIVDCLDSVKKFAEEVVIVDGNSHDHTVEIAKNLGARTIVTENKPLFHILKQKAIGMARGDWVLQLDADERVSPQLADEIKRVIESKNAADGYWIKRKKQFLGRWIKKGGHYPDPVVRLFRRRKGKFPQTSVHEQIEIAGQIGWLENELIHLPTPSFSAYITKDNRYSTLFAHELFAINPGTGPISFIRFFIFSPVLIFISIYVRHLGFVDGFPGFIFAFYSGLTKASAYVKYWEFKHNPQTRERIAQDWR